MYVCVGWIVLLLTIVTGFHPSPLFQYNKHKQWLKKKGSQKLPHTCSLSQFKDICDEVSPLVEILHIAMNDFQRYYSKIHAQKIRIWARFLSVQYLNYRYFESFFSVLLPLATAKKHQDSQLDKKMKRPTPCTKAPTHTFTKNASQKPRTYE
jgi:hypothetical protein